MMTNASRDLSECEDATLLGIMGSGKGCHGKEGSKGGDRGVKVRQKEQVTFIRLKR